MVFLLCGLSDRSTSAVVFFGSAGVGLLVIDHLAINSRKGTTAQSASILKTAAGGIKFVAADGWLSCL